MWTRGKTELGLTQGTPWRACPGIASEISFFGLRDTDYLGDDGGELVCHLCSSPLQHR